MPVAPVLLAPRHCIRSQDRGVRARRKPTRPLHWEGGSLSAHAYSKQEVGGSIGKKLHRCRISKRPPQLPAHFCLRSQVQLLEQLCRYGHSARRLGSVQRLIDVIAIIDFGFLAARLVKLGRGRHYSQAKSTRFEDKDCRLRTGWCWRVRSSIGST